jgi:hypothetical protein
MADRDTPLVFSVSNEFSPFSRRPERLAIAGFPTITAIRPSFSLIAITGQSSYPLNSENASPFGTCKVYLSCAEIAAPAAKMAIDAEMLRLISELFFHRRISLIGLGARDDQ